MLLLLLEELQLLLPLDGHPARRVCRCGGAPQLPRLRGCDFGGGADAHILGFQLQEAVAGGHLRAGF